MLETLTLIRCNLLMYQYLGCADGVEMKMKTDDISEEKPKKKPSEVNN